MESDPRYNGEVPFFVRRKRIRNKNFLFCLINICSLYTRFTRNNQVPCNVFLYWMNYLLTNSSLKQNSSYIRACYNRVRLYLKVKNWYCIIFLNIFLNIYTILIFFHIILLRNNVKFK